MIITLIWMICTSLVLMPAGLVEFRYFTCPLLFLFIEFRNTSLNEVKKKDSSSDDFK
jgi:hypothetical protein